MLVHSAEGETPDSGVLGQYLLNDRVVDQRDAALVNLQNRRKSQCLTLLQAALQIADGSDLQNG